MIALPVESLYGFLLVLARVAATFTVIPMPHLRDSGAPPRIVLFLGITLALQFTWPSIPISLNGGLPELWPLLERMVAEVVFGLAIGLVVALLSESFSLAMQILGIQAGYGYASSIDPTSAADSGVLVVMAQLTSWLLLLAFGIDRHVIRALAASLEKYPAGAFAISPEARSAVLSLGSVVFTTAVRLALPVVALLLLVDIAFALFGKLHAQLQLLSLAFPAKMLTTLGILALLSAAFPRIYEGIAARGVAALRLLGS